MSHIHIPDGVLPIWLIALGWVLTGAVLALVLWRLRRVETGRQLPLVGVMAATMLVGMSLEIVPIAYHTNLSVLAGIVLGPALGFVAALIVNLMLALFGHGGITVVGLNVLVLWVEIAIGYYLFRGVWALLRRRQRSPAISAGVATTLTLMLSTLLMIGIVGLSNLDSATYASVASESLSFRNPFEHGLVTSEFLARDPEHVETPAAAAEGMDLFTFARLVIAFGVLGWLLEAAVTGAMVGFVYRVRPGLVAGNMLHRKHG